MRIEEIKDRLKTSDKELYKKMGYNTQKLFEKTLNKFFESKDIKEWLLKSHYDLVNSSNQFFNKLAKELGVDESEIKEIIHEYERCLKEKKKFENSYIFVNTNFRRTTESNLTLGYAERIRRISLSDREDLYFKSEEEILQEVSKIVKEHYKETNGELKIWGKIANYQVHLEEKTFVFDIDGNLLKKPVKLLF